MFKKSAAMISCLLLTAPAFAQGKTLTLATSADYPPYEFPDLTSGQEKIIGFDIDIAEHITKELKFNLKVVNMDFNGLLPALQAKRADFIMAGMTPTDERKKNVEFSDLYFQALNMLVSRKDSNITSWQQLKGKKVGVQLGTTQEKAAKQLTGIEVVPLNRIGEIIQEIKSKRLAGAIIEDAVAIGHVKRNSDLIAVKADFEGEAGSAIAFPKGSPLVKPFNAELKKMKEQGLISKLAEKWFGRDVLPAKK